MLDPLYVEPALATEPALEQDTPATEPARMSLEARAEEEDSSTEDEPMLTLLMVFLTTTSVSCTSVDFSLRADADAKTLSLERNWLRVDSASSARFSADSSSRWNFFTLMMFELEMDSCSSSCLLYILIFSFSLSRESWRMMMFFLPSSDCRMSSLMLLVLVCSSVMVTEWDFFSLLIITSSSSIRTSIFWMVLLLVATELVSISSILTLRLLTSFSRDFLAWSIFTSLACSSLRRDSKW